MGAGQLTTVANNTVAPPATRIRRSTRRLHFGNRRYVRFMYQQMICPVLERLQAMAGPAMRRTEQVQGLSVDEVRGGLRRTHRGGLMPGGGGRRFWVSRSAPSGAGATATRRRAPNGPYDRRLGRLSMRGARRRTRRRKVLELFDTRYWDFSGQALPRGSGGRARLQAPLQLAAAELASPPASGARRPGVGRTGASGRAVRLPGMMLHLQDGSSHFRGSPVDGGT